MVRQARVRQRLVHQHVAWVVVGANPRVVGDCATGERAICAVYVGDVDVREPELVVSLADEACLLKMRACSSRSERTAPVSRMIRKNR